MRRFAPLLLLGTACARIMTGPVPHGAHAVSVLRHTIDSLTADTAFANANWGVLVVDPETRDTLYSRNAGKLFMPASNLKLLTSATALTQLGPDYRFKTVFASRGPLVEGSIDGDLLVFGRGDPTVSDHMRGDAMTALHAMADSLLAHGVHHVRGSVVATGDAFPSPVLGYGWSYDDFEASYSAPTDELLFNEGFSVLHVHAGDRVGDAVRVVSGPARSYPRVRVMARTSEPAPPVDSSAPRRANARRRNQLRAQKDTLAGDVVLDGTLPLGDSALVEVTDRDPDGAYITALREALSDRGISIEGIPSDTARGGTLDTLFVELSPPLSVVLPALLKPSQNQIAEMLFKTIALEATGAGNTDSARAVVQRQVAAWGVPASEAVIRDGSGLSRYDYITPRTAVRVLDAMRTSPNFKVFYDALPIAGVDGSIATRMRGTPAQGNVHAKTGSVALARSLSGYVTTADGHLLMFSFLANNWTTPVRDVERVQDAICARLAEMRLR